jgi:hypothetical protein
MRSLAGITLALVALAAGVPARADSSTVQHVTTAAADTGEQIKDGAEKVGTAIKDGAVDLWEASKAAVAAGSKTLSERRATREHDDNTANARRDAEK